MDAASAARSGAISGSSVAIIVIALAIVVLTCGGVVAYRRALPGGSYEGSMGGGVARGMVLGLFLGLTVGLATLWLVLVVRALR